MTPNQLGAETLVPGGKAPEPANGLSPSPAEPAATILLPIDLGNLRVTEVLATGGMGATFLGTLVTYPTRRVVVKIPLTSETHLLERFNNEVSILSLLQHPNIVRFVETGESDIRFGTKTRKVPWLAMEHVTGDSLRAKLKGQAKLGWSEIQILLNDVLHALEYLNSKNLCHRDIKPDNLIYDQVAKAWKLIDFGIAKKLINTNLHSMTMGQTTPGAMGYMSPEQQQGQPLNIRSDIYSLGKTAWEALIGRLPVPLTPLPSAMLGPALVPPHVDELIRKMTMPEVGDRYQSPTEVLKALERGAPVIDWRRFLRFLTFSAGAAALLALVWMTGNQFQTQHAKDIVDSVSPSDTKQTRIRQKLSVFRNNHSFWGRRYADEQYAKADQGAAAELATMRKSFATLERELAAAAHPDDYKYNRCENFCKTYGEVFRDTTEVHKLLSQRDVFLAKVNAAKAEAFATGGKFGEAFALLEQTRTNLNTSVAVSLLVDTRSNIVDRYVNTKLSEAEMLLNTDSAESIQQAITAVTQIQNIVGPTPTTQDTLKKADNLLFSLTVSNVNAHLTRREYDLARADLDKYFETAPLPTHREDAATVREKIREIEDDNDWQDTTNYANKNLAQNTFKAASDNYQNYLKKWPSGRHAAEARLALNEVVVKHGQFLRMINNYDDFIEEFDKFLEMYPSEQNQQALARKLLVYQVRKEIGRLWSEVEQTNISRSTAYDHVCQLKYTKAATDHRQYLDRLGESMKGYLRSPSPNGSKSFFYLYQRPPSVCVKMTQEPTVYYITLNSLSFNLSESVYMQIKGKRGNDADPRVRINLCKDSTTGNYPAISEVFKALGAVNQRSFYLSIQQSLYFTKGSEVLDTCLDDDSLFGDKNILRARWRATTSGFPQSSTFRWKDGSTMTLNYTQQ